MKQTRIILCLFFLFVSAIQLAVCKKVSAESFCGGNAEVLVVYGNGIMCTEKEAEKSKAVLKKRLRSFLSSEELSRLEFKIAYNHSYGFMSDLYESLKQKVVSDNFAISFWRWIGNIDAVPDVVRDTIKDMVSDFDVSEYFGEEDIANHIALYRTAIAEGKTVLLVAHSQGNLFANSAYQILYERNNSIETRSFGIVSVANPASFVAGNGPYTTLEEDVVIGAIAATAGAVGTALPLSPNITNIGDGTSSDDWKGHSFQDAYLIERSRSEGQIMDDVISEMASLVPPNQIAQSGIITVTLTWGDQPDVDLHVMEPNGMHVYYPNLQGISGYLDLDDVTSHGPEHYFVSCDTLEEGIYTVGVNYFCGTLPEQALVQIKAGNSIRSFTVDLSEVRGSSGDSSPVEVAEIIVSGDSLYGYSFLINSLLP